ncbi:dihydroorotase [Kovacikia minuta CCNUW1]|uniref:dihydroorotase n=1 Tax=Kovacikia minuta TaxID=2931930 RepID=UPI001CCB0E18|nr:dihydroorotase [Kovacikia minuta]UBF25746.1 dihydroorotase [Kovacikia minuta CCNUW1]
MTSELLQQVRVLDPVSGTDRIADVLIRDGIIQSVEETLTEYPDETIVQNCQGLILGPGLVDLYSHSGEPGFEERETLASLMQAAGAGGFTRVAILPDTVPAIDNPAGVKWLKQKAEGRGQKGEGRSQEPASIQNSKFKIQNSFPTPHTPYPTPSLHCWAALTVGVQGQQMTELAELAAVEIVGFADGRPLNNLALVRRLLEYGRSLDKSIALWANDTALAGNGVMREGQESIRLGLPGVPAIAETVALSTLLEIIEVTGTPVHLMRISTARGVELIRAAKSRGIPITASSSWLHLLLNSESIRTYDPNLRLDPPLGNPTDQAALLKALQEGVLDAIAIDHTPYSYEEKTVAFAEAPPGAIGLELALPLLWAALVETGTWSALDLWRSLSTQPARCLAQKPATITPQQPAELILFNPTYLWKVEGRTLKSLSTNTPWLGQEIAGRVEKIWVP